MDAEAILNRLAQLEERKPAAAQEVRDAWFRTLACLDEPDGTIIEIAVAGGPPIRQDIATLRRQLGEHLEELDPTCICYPGHHDVPGGREPACPAP